jgi:hypothetical protein
MLGHFSRSSDKAMVYRLAPDRPVRVSVADVRARKPHLFIDLANPIIKTLYYRHGSCTSYSDIRPISSSLGQTALEVFDRDSEPNSAATAEGEIA